MYGTPRKRAESVSAAPKAAAKAVPAAAIRNNRNNNETNCPAKAGQFGTVSKNYEKL
jgi:hypothetical protein